jgi:hypothetical protein
MTEPYRGARLVNVRVVLTDAVKALHWPSHPPQVLVGPGTYRMEDGHVR